MDLHQLTVILLLRLDLLNLAHLLLPQPSALFLDLVLPYEPSRNRPGVSQGFARHSWDSLEILESQRHLIYGRIVGDFLEQQQHQPSAPRRRIGRVRPLRPPRARHRRRTLPARSTR